MKHLDKSILVIIDSANVFEWGGKYNKVYKNTTLINYIFKNIVKGLMMFNKKVK